MIIKIKKIYQQCPITIRLKLMIRDSEENKKD